MVDEAASSNIDQNVEVLEMLLSVTWNLVDFPSAVQIDVLHNESSTTFKISVAPNDLGKVIGKSGRTARALRHLVTATAVKQKRTLLLDIERMRL